MSLRRSDREKLDVDTSGMPPELSGLSATDVQAFLEQLSKDTSDANLKKAIADVLQKEKDTVQQFMDKNIENGVEALKEYMTVFAGAERANNIKKITLLLHMFRTNTLTRTR